MLTDSFIYLKKKKKTATVQRLKPNWHCSNGTKYIYKIKELNKSNVYCKDIGVFYIVNRNVFSFSCG